MVNLLFPIPLVDNVTFVAWILKLEAISAGALQITATINVPVRTRSLAFMATILLANQNPCLEE